MLRTAKAFKKLIVRASDGAVGCLRDIHFEDTEWEVAQLEVEMVGETDRGTIFISTGAVVSPGSGRDEIAFDLSTQHGRASTPIPTDGTQDNGFDSIYRWSPYGSASAPRDPDATAPGPSAGKLSDIIPFAAEKVQRTCDTRQPDRSSEPRLRSLRELAGYRIEALDGDIGHIGDLVIDDQRWAIPFVVIDTRNWWPGTHVMVPSGEILGMSRADRIVFVSLSRQVIQGSPEFDPAIAISAEYRSRLDAYYSHLCWR